MKNLVVVSHLQQNVTSEIPSFMLNGDTKVRVKTAVITPSGKWLYAGNNLFYQNDMTEMSSCVLVIQIPPL